MSSEFDGSFTDFASAEPVAMYKFVSHLAQIYEDVADTAYKLNLSLTQLHKKMKYSTFKKTFK